MTSTSTPTPASAQSAPPGWPPVAAIATTLVLWASAFVAIRHLGHDVSPGALSLGRLLIAAVALSFFLVRAPRSRFTRAEVLLLLACGIAWFGIYNIALNAGEQRIDAATAAMVVQIGPILIAFLAALFLGEALLGAVAGPVVMEDACAEAGRDGLGAIRRTGIDQDDVVGKAGHRLEHARQPVGLVLRDDEHGDRQQPGPCGGGF